MVGGERGLNQVTSECCASAIFRFIGKPNGVMLTTQTERRHHRKFVNVRSGGQTNGSSTIRRSLLRE